MVTAIRPEHGGMLRPFGTAWFIIEFLKGYGPEDSNGLILSDGKTLWQ